jgi:hypothetical protein
VKKLDRFIAESSIFLSLRSAISTFITDNKALMRRMHGTLVELVRFLAPNSNLKYFWRQIQKYFFGAKVKIFLLRKI